MTSTTARRPLAAKPLRRAAAGPARDAPGTEPAPDTRGRILQVALDMVREQGNAAISLSGVAIRAGLSRQTLYLLFRSRAGLLMAMVDHLDETDGAPARLAALRQAGGDDFEPYVRAWLDYLPRVLPVARALSAAATSGDVDAAEAWQSRMRKLRAGFAQVARGLHGSGRLRPDWTPAAAADWMVALTHVDLWQQLVVDAGWKPAAHVERIVSTLRTTLLRD